MSINITWAWVTGCPAQLRCRPPPSSVSFLWHGRRNLRNRERKVAQRTPSPVLSVGPGGIRQRPREAISLFKGPEVQGGIICLVSLPARWFPGLPPSLHLLRPAPTRAWPPPALPFLLCRIAPPLSHLTHCGFLPSLGSADQGLAGF